MKTYMPLNGLRWSRNSGSANCDIPQSAVFGRPGEGARSRSDFELLDEYDGGLPFLVGGIVTEDLDGIKAVSNPCFAGVDLNEGFETKPGIKDTSKLKDFISLLRK